MARDWGKEITVRGKGQLLGMIEIFHVLTVVVVIG
jgi:hypothetical protein